VKYSELVENISDSYDDIITNKKTSIKIEYLDNDESGYMYWETYHVPNTVFRLYMHNEINVTTDIGNISLSVEIDPDYMNHSDFKQGKPDVYNFEYDLEKYDDGKSDKESNRVYDELKKGFDKQIAGLIDEAKNCLKNIEKDLDVNQTMESMSDTIIAKHIWAVQEWIKMVETLKLSGFDIGDIPLTLKAFNLDEDERFLPQAVKDMFVF